MSCCLKFAINCRKKTEHETTSVIAEIFISTIQHTKGEHLLSRPILSYLVQSLNHPYAVHVNWLTLSSNPLLNMHRCSPIALGQCAELFLALCALGDHAKKAVVDAGALPGLCRLAHRDGYGAK
jgi:hypothetical protein